MFRTLLIVLVASLVAAACAGADDTSGYATPESAVVGWFEAIDAGDTVAASSAVYEDSLTVVLSIENALPVDTTVAYLTGGVPLDVQESYWRSFAAGFTEFASRPISTLRVGEATPYTSEGVDFASVPVSGGPASDSVVITRMRPDGSWEVDMVASLGVGFVTLMMRTYDELPADESGDAVRAAYAETVVPGLWAAMADGSFGDDFARSALALIGRVEK